MKSLDNNKLVVVMKKLFFAVLILAVTSQYSQAQCNADDFTSQCIPKLADGFNFLKGYKIDGRGGERDKIEYSYVFTKGTQYMINVCSPGESVDGIVINLFDSRRNRVATSSIDGQVASAIAFPCNATGIYYISYAFESSTQYCGGSALGFSK
jgi:hypothetical protein